MNGQLQGKLTEKQPWQVQPAMSLKGPIEVTFYCARHPYVPCAIPKHANALVVTWIYYVQLTVSFTFTIVFSGLYIDSVLSLSQSSI